MAYAEGFRVLFSFGVCQQNHIFMAKQEGALIHLCNGQVVT